MPPGAVILDINATQDLTPEVVLGCSMKCPLVIVGINPDLSMVVRYVKGIGRIGRIYLAAEPVRDQTSVAPPVVSGIPA